MTLLLMPSHPLMNDTAWAMYYRDGLTPDQIAEKIDCNPSAIVDGLQEPLIQMQNRFAESAAKLIVERNKRITDLQDLLIEQNKTVINLTEAVATLNGKKFAKADVSKPKFKFGGKTSYLQSLIIGLREGLWNAPMIFWREMKLPLGAILASSVLFLTGLVSWIVAVLVIVGAGIGGRLAPVKEEA